MKVLIGTTNPSKVKRFEELLDGCDIEFCTLSDLGICTEPEETGKTPEENAVIKAKYYGSFCDFVICNDSGLYFEDLPMDDYRQPGPNIREPEGSRRLNDEEMIEYYSGLVHSLGGRVTAYYLDGIAVNNRGIISSFMENSESRKENAFYMVDTPSEKRHAGWPLDSLSLNRKELTYFVCEGDKKYDMSEEDLVEREYRKRLIRFLKWALGILPEKNGLEIIPAYGFPQEIGALFSEYTDMLVEGDSSFQRYLDVQCYDEELKHLETKYGFPYGRLYLARYNGEMAGCIALRRIDDHNCEMKRLYVRQQFRGKQIGDRLVQKIITEAKKAGYSYMLLDTLPFLRGALHLYKKYGFCETGRYNDSPMDSSIYMKLDLAGEE